MDLSVILSFLGDSVPIGVVVLIVLQFYGLNEIKHIRKDLSNHITETNQKIDTLSDRFDRLYEILLKKNQK